MAEPSENTPLLTEDGRLADRDENRSQNSKNFHERSQFTLTITALRVLISFLSLCTFGILIATYVLIATGPFDYVVNSETAIRALAIVVLVNVTLCTLTIFIQTPTVFNIPLTLTMAIVLLFFSDHLIGKGWPDAEEGYYKIFCIAIWRSPSDQSPDPECERARDVVKILMSVTGGIGILIALLLVAVMLLEIAALGRREPSFKGHIGVESVPTERPAVSTNPF